MYRIGKEIYTAISSCHDKLAAIESALVEVPFGHAADILKKEKAQLAARVSELEKETWVDRDTYNGLKRRLQLMSGLPAELINDIVNGPDPGFESQIFPTEGYKNKS
jgi:hypothetical protein